MLAFSFSIFLIPRIGVCPFISSTILKLRLYLSRICCSRLLGILIIPPIGEVMVDISILKFSIVRLFHFGPIKPRKAIAIMRIRITTPIDHSSVRGDLYDP